MAEDPATWGPVERAISEALKAHEKARAEGRIGFSLARKIADKLREQGLVKDEKPNG